MIPERLAASDVTAGRIVGARVTRNRAFEGATTITPLLDPPSTGSSTTS
jgi:hypothetical protein